MDWSFKFEVDENFDLEEDFKDSDDSNGTIFLIDCSKSLFEKKFKSNSDNLSNHSWFEAIVSACLSTAKNMAGKANKDVVGVVFFRTEKSSNSTMKNVYTFQNLEQPNVQIIKSLIELKSISLDKFSDQYGFGSTVSLFHALWCCQIMFSKCKEKPETKEVIVFTSDDNPIAGNTALEKNLFTKARDLREANIHVEIILLGNEDNFHGEKFYNKFLKYNTNEKECDSTSICSFVTLFDDMMTRVRHKQYRKRVTCKVMWKIGNDNLVISANVFNLIGKFTGLKSVQLDRNTNSEIVVKKVKYLEGTDQMLMPFDMKYRLKISDRAILFESEELKKIRSLVEPGIKLIGFKPFKYLKKHHHIRNSQFLYPDDSVIKGSADLFSALLKRCFDRKLFALCTYSPRKNMPVRLVALVPQLEIVDSKGIQTHPPGFHIIFLPFAEDIRSLDLLICNDEVNEEDKEICKELIESLAQEYNPVSILNPALQKKLAIIEAIALDMEKPDKTEDYTNISNENINEHCGDVLMKVKAHFDLSYKESKHAASKRPPAPVTDDIQILCSTGQLEKLTIPQLKDLAKSHGIKIKGTKKSDIVSSIMSHF